MKKINLSNVKEQHEYEVYRYTKYLSELDPETYSDKPRKTYMGNTHAVSKAQACSNVRYRETKCEEMPTGEFDNYVEPLSGYSGIDIWYEAVMVN